MALSIGVKKGSKVNIGGVREGGHMEDGNKGPRLVGYTLSGGDVLEVLEVVTTNAIRVKYKEENFVVTDQERTKLDEEVFVSCGLWNGKGDPEYSRLAFEAPKSIRIERVAS